MSKYIEGSEEFSDVLGKVGKVSYDIHNDFSRYAGFLEGLMYGMFHDLSDHRKKYYVKRVTDELHELKAERSMEAAKLNS